MLKQTPDIDTNYLNDRDLLRRFVQDADETAFAEIVQRHQGLVMGVCRRILGDDPDADDAFQATFIALARRPRSIQKETSLSSWLYTVAWRTGWRLIKKRRKHPVEPLTSHPLDESADALDRIASAQDCLVLDEELNELPAKFREVLIMTYFAGQTSQQIADQLSVSKGTVDGRIRQGRNILRVQLARRGVAIGALTVAAGLSSGPAAAAGPALMESTLQLGAQTLSRSLPGTTDLSHLEPLIRPETAMISSKLIVSSVLCVSALAGAAGLNGLLPAEGIADEAQAIRATDVSDSSAEAPATGNGQPKDRGEVSAPAILVSDTDAFATVGGIGPAVADTANGRTFQHYSADAAPVEKWMHEMLDKPVMALDFPGDTPLSEILLTIEHNFNVKYGNDAGIPMAMNFLPDVGELGLEQISSLEDITISDINFDGMSLRNALKHIFNQTIDDSKSPVPLTVVIRDEVMMVTTLSKARMEEMMTTRVYSVGHLLTADLDESMMGGGAGAAGVGFFSLQSGEGGMGGMDGMGGGMGGGGFGQDMNEPVPDRPRTKAELLVELIVEMTTNSDFDNWSASSGGNGTVGDIRVFGSNLVVRQTQHMHEQIVDLLNLLSKAVQQ